VFYIIDMSQDNVYTFVMQYSCFYCVHSYCLRVHTLSRLWRSFNVFLLHFWHFCDHFVFDTASRSNCIYTFLLVNYEQGNCAVVSTLPQTTSAERLASLSPEYLPAQDITPIKCSSGKKISFEIHDATLSENALLLFNNKYVFKILRPYADRRYSLTELYERHNCLIEGLYWNRFFTKEVYYGLARYYKAIWKQNKLTSIVLGEFLKFLNSDEDQEQLDDKAEYVLVMRKLPSMYRLDMLLKDGANDSRQRYLSILTQFLAHMHTSSTLPPAKSSGTKSWGSVTQLRDKLDDNLATVAEPDITDTAILASAEYRSLRSMGESLKEMLILIFANHVCQHYFAQRVRNQKIKRCHGDLKARNIWILPRPDPQAPNHSEILDDVHLLDAIDFNPDFCKIDILSDFAMLVADIHTRTGSSELANSMIEDYLRLTKQDNRASRFVLDYYLIEKAFVGALVSILYDSNPRLGRRYLEVCTWYLTEFKSKIPSTP
jgi:aminoglycoside phosphotransferase family enzyme